VSPYKKRVLLIEDDDEMRSLLKEFMEGEGFEADCAANGFEALPKLEEKDFDLIVSDIRMPGLTGLDLLPRMKTLQPGAYIVVITSFGSEEVYRKSVERGATAYLEKPIHFERLRELVHEAASSKEMEEARR
jgi:DNA-binding NtrC family response regulator